jgi:Ca2+/Na+ antiporter
MSGSTIVVSTVALGICMVSGAAARPSGHVVLFHGVRVQGLILLASLFVLFLLIVFEFNLFIGIVGILEYCVFAIFTLFFKPSEVRPEDRLLPMNAASFASLEDAALEKNDMLGDEDDEDSSKNPAWKGWLFLALGGANIYIFSTPFIHSVIELGNVFSIKPMLLAFFLAPLASEAPEILESFTLSRKGRTQNINIAGMIEL